MNADYTVRPGDTIRLAPAPFIPAPEDIGGFLFSRGWSRSGDYWVHLTKGRYSMAWEQAVACEFYEFITLGGR